MEHDHFWQASDIPGVCICQCNGVRYYNRLTKEYCYE